MVIAMFILVPFFFLLRTALRQIFDPAKVSPISITIYVFSLEPKNEERRGQEELNMFIMSRIKSTQGLRAPVP